MEHEFEYSTDWELFTLEGFSKVIQSALLKKNSYLKFVQEFDEEYKGVHIDLYEIDSDGTHDKGVVKWFITYSPLTEEKTPISVRGYFLQHYCKLIEKDTDKEVFYGKYEDCVDYHNVNFANITDEEFFEKYLDWKHFRVDNYLLWSEELGIEIDAQPSLSAH